MAVRLLASREHSRAELERKLSGRFDDELLNSVLDDLTTRGLLSDERFAEQYVAMRLRKGYGPVRIAQELRERGIDASMVGSVMEQLDADWYTLMQEAHDKKFGSSSPCDYKEATKRARFLEYRGYSSEMIRDYLLD